MKHSLLGNLKLFAESRLKIAEEELEKRGYYSDFEKIEDIASNVGDAFTLGRYVAMEGLMQTLLRVIKDTEIEIKQYIKSACEFYLKYMSNGTRLLHDYPELRERYDKEVFSRFKLKKLTVYLVDEVSMIPFEQHEEDLRDTDLYNEWLLKLAFKDVFEEED